MTGESPPLWRRNTAAGIVGGVALTVVAATQLWPEWARYRDTVLPAQIVARGGQASMDGQRWRVDAVRRLETAPGPAVIPDGAVRIVVTISRDGPGFAGTCAGTLSDGTRRWAADPVAGPTGSGTTTVCSLPGNLEFVFQTPAEVTPTALDVTGSADRILVRFLL